MVGILDTRFDCQVLSCPTDLFAEEDHGEDDQPADDAFTDSDSDRPAWVQKYLDLADLAIKRSEDEEDEPTQNVA